MLKMVEENVAKYTTTDKKWAEEAQSLQKRVGFPSTGDYLTILKNKIPGCKSVRDDAIAAENIWGPLIPNLKGKTTRSTPAAVRVEYSRIPRAIMQRFHEVTLEIDTMFVNGLKFLVMISELQFGT